MGRREGRGGEGRGGKGYKEGRVRGIMMQPTKKHDKNKTYLYMNFTKFFSENGFERFLENYFPSTYQILLNFFVAVILDNLEYPEEKKQRKLEQEQQPKRERVPFHLRIFQYCKPKCVPAPKLSSNEPPILTGKIKLVYFFVKQLACRFRYVFLMAIVICTRAYTQITYSAPPAFSPSPCPP